MSPLPAPQVPQSFEARVSTTKQLGLVAIGIALVALIGLAPSRDLGGGWAVHLTIALLIASFFVPAILELRRAGPAIVMNDAGIDDRRLGVGPIPWDSIERIEIVSVRGVCMLEVRLTDPAPLLARMTIYRHLMARANKSLGYPEIMLNFAGLTPGINEAIRYLDDRFHIRRGE